MDSTVIIAIAASLLALALFIALTAVMLVVGLLWMQSSRRPRRVVLDEGEDATFLFDPSDPVETFVPPGYSNSQWSDPRSGSHPQWGGPLRSGSHSQWNAAPSNHGRVAPPRTGSGSRVAPSRPWSQQPPPPRAQMPPGFFSDAPSAEDGTRTELFRENEVRDFWAEKGEDPDSQDVLATEIFSAQAIDFAGLGLDDHDEPSDRFRR